MRFGKFSVVDRYPVGGLAHAKVLRSRALMARHVLPAVRA